MLQLLHAWESDAREPLSNHRGGDFPGTRRACCRGEGPIQRMRSAGAIDQNESAAAGGHGRPPGVERGGKALCVVRCPPCRQNLIPDFIERHARAFRLRALPWCRVCDGTTSFKEAGRFHRVRDVGTAFLAKCLRNSPVVLAAYERKPAFMFGDPGNLFPARVLMPKVGSAAVFPDKGVDHVRVLPTILPMENTTTLVSPQTEFGFVMTEECRDDVVRIRRLGRRIHMDMMDWSGRPAVRGIGNKLGDLSLEIFRRETAGWHHKHLLAVFRAGKMPRKGRAAGSAGCPGNHFVDASATRSRWIKATTSTLAARRSRISNSRESCSRIRSVSRQAFDNWTTVPVKRPR
jgi:hypothetical protein